jgi:2-hydroxy-4-carboxymuconate semialdehyde hemiacetal dehydrogenase
MGVWHTEALIGQDAVLHTLVGRRAEPAADFARKYGYRNITTSLGDALADPAIDAVIIASPSQMHVEHAHACLAAGKNTLIEIPMAMNAADSEAITNAAEASGLAVAVSHPKRYRPESIELAERIKTGAEIPLLVESRFHIYRYENVGATGYRRSWVDNSLWHHAAHLVDFGIWMTGDPAMSVDGWMSKIEPKTGIPMTTHIRGETASGALVSHLLSYYPKERVYEVMVVTDRDSYRIDLLRNTLTTDNGTRQLANEQANCALVTQDFIEACRSGRRPAVTPRDVLPAMQALQKVQDQWDRRYGAQSLPGRAVA